jgi:lysophospholipase L1-like esterase
MLSTTDRNNKVSSASFYSEYHGHRVKHLERLYPVLRESCDSLIWAAGDSSLDNKHWFSDPQPAVGAYREVLDPPSSNADVTYWLNYLSLNNRRGHPTRLAAINTAVEATTVNERTFRLRSQDRFLRDNLKSNDILVVSVGGNDVAMAPAPCTIVSVLSLVCMPATCLENGCARAPIPVS